jgi:hypothetical protein
MIYALITALLITISPQDTIPSSQEKVDTLQEVEVVAPEQLQALENALRQSLGRYTTPHTPSVSDVLDKLSPGLTDKIMHPFAFKERKRAKKRKRDQKILDEYGKIKTFDDLLREAIEREGIILPERKESKSR